MNPGQPYESYRSTEVPWLSRVPSHWSVLRGRVLTEPVKRPPSADDGVVTAFRDGQVTLRSNRRLDGFTEALQEIGYQGVRQGELVIHSMDGFAGAIGVSESDGKMSPVVHIYRSVDSDPRFLAQALRVAAGSGYIASLARGIRERSTSFDRSTFRDLLLPAPPLDEQRRIAEFLDRETAQIDAVIAKQEQFIALLKERSKAVLDQHFQTTAGKRRATVRQTLVKITRPPSQGLGIVTAYRDGVVTLRSNRREEGYTFSETEAGYQDVVPGDLVFHALDGFAGAVGVSDSHGACSPVYHVCQPRGRDDGAYLALLLRYLGTSGFLAVQAPNTRQRSVDFRNWSTFARVPLWLPPVEEQRAFVARYKERRRVVDALIAKASELIALAKERRAALITEAVTGRIDVSLGRAA